jgi:2-keto-4-pentenoate hydratase/2-oxohepta-3-ene-1,7-dioic acid hydratase in catechol pathway
MRFVTVDAPEGPRAGVVVDDQVALAPQGTTMLDLLSDPDGLVGAGARLMSSPVTVQPLEGSRLLAPIPQPPTVRDFMTFERHVEGVSMLMGDGGRPVEEWYQFPVFYFTNPYAVTGPYDDIPVPPGCEVLDFELEVAAVVGTPGRDIAEEDAESHIAGYLIMNDWSARDLQRVEMRAHMGPVKGKDTATTMGPALVSADELAPYRSGASFDLGMSVAVNGELLGTDRLSNMTWGFASMVSYASRGTWVRPGDVLGSGTCASGCLAELWGRHGRGVHAPLSVGDTVTMEVDVLGTIRNTVVPGSPVRPLAPRLPRGQ